MRKLSAIPAPAVAGVIREKTTKAAIAEMKNCRLSGADMIDLHLSCLENFSTAELKKIIRSTPLPILALNYNQKADWTSLGLSEEERVQSFLDAVEAGAAGIDMQGYTFHAPSKSGYCGEDIYFFTKNNPKEIVTDPVIIEKQCAFIEEVHRRGAEVLLSCHPGIAMNTQQVVELALFLEQRKPDMIKIVTHAENEDDFYESIRTMTVLKKEVKTPVSYHANGKAGTLSRILNPLLGGQIAFCVDRYNEYATMEQLELKTVRSIVDHMRRLGAE